MLDPEFLSHAIAWVIGGMTLCAVITATGALVAMSRTSYRKD